jgi:hypothetical protein
MPDQQTLPPITLPSPRIGVQIPVPLPPTITGGLGSGVPMGGLQHPPVFTNPHPVANHPQTNAPHAPHAPVPFDPATQGSFGSNNTFLAPLNDPWASSTHGGSFGDLYTSYGPARATLYGSTTGFTAVNSYDPLNNGSGNGNRNNIHRDRAEAQDRRLAQDPRDEMELEAAREAQNKQEQYIGTSNDDGNGDG